jgi:hypothetical protein
MGGGKVAQAMYIHVSKCKSNKILKRKKKEWSMKLKRTYINT